MLHSAQLAEKLKVLHTNPSDETLCRLGLARIEELEELLTEILNSGDWYCSALELDHDYDGYELEQKIKSTLGVEK